MRIETNFNMEVNLGINTSTGNLLNPKELDSLRLDPTFCHFSPRGPWSHAEIHLSKSAKLPNDLKLPRRNALKMPRGN